MSDPQALASQQGEMFEEQGRMILRSLGASVSDRPVVIDGTGVEVDAIIEAPRPAYVEFKGSWRGVRPGLLRSDTVKKAVADGFVLQVRAPGIPYLVITSHLPAVGSHGDLMMQAALDAGAVFDVFCTSQPEDMARLAAFEPTKETAA